jgi:uncharacterized protein (DUF2062 family)
MWHYSRAAARRWVQSLLHVHDTPERTALAVGLGVAIGFSPFIGLHTAMAVALAFFLNLNRVAVLAGAWLNLPWIMAAYYAGATALGAWLLRTPVPPHLMSQIERAWSLSGWDSRIGAFASLVEPLIWPFALGSLIGSAVLGPLAYHLLRPILVARYRHHQQILEAARSNK